MDHRHGRQSHQAIEGCPTLRAFRRVGTTNACTTAKEPKQPSSRRHGRSRALTNVSAFHPRRWTSANAHAASRAPAKPSPKNRMRPKASHLEPHRYVDSCFALVTAARWMTASARQRSEERRFCRSPLQPATLRSRTTTATVASKPSPDQRSGEEAATPGQPVAYPRFWKFPLALPQSSGKLRTLTFSLHSLSARTLIPAIKNKSTPVQNLWTTGLPCGSTRKTERNSRALDVVILLLPQPLTPLQIALEVIHGIFHAG